MCDPSQPRFNILYMCPGEVMTGVIQNIIRFQYKLLFYTVDTVVDNYEFTLRILTFSIQLQVYCTQSTQRIILTITILSTSRLINK